MEVDNIKIKKNMGKQESITVTDLIEDLQILQEEGYGDFPVMFSDELELIHLLPICEEVGLFKVKKMCTGIDNTLFANTIHVWEEETLVLKGKLNRNYDQMTYSKKIKGE